MNTVNIKKMFLAMLAAAFLPLAGCGGSGAGAGGSSDGSAPMSPRAPSTPAVASILVKGSSPTINSDGMSKVTVTATVRDSSNVALTGQTVAFSTPDTGTVITVLSSTTDVAGTAAAEVEVADPALRDIVVTAISGSTKGSVTIRVVGGGSSAASISVGVSSPTIDSDGASKVTVAATVKGLGNVAMPGQSVSFSTEDAGTTLTVESSVTDGTGTAIAGLAIEVGDPTHRDIVVKAVSGAMIGFVTVRVTGSVLTLLGSSSIPLEGSSAYIVNLRDSAGTAVVGAPVTLETTSDSATSAIATTTKNTDSQGQARFTVSGIAAGILTLKASALGISQSKEVVVAGDIATFQEPAPGAEVLVKTSQRVRVMFLRNGVKLPAGSNIQFSATRGQVVPVSTGVDSAGFATVAISSSTAGPSTITALDEFGTTAAVEFEFVSRIPSEIRLQASPTTVPVNLAGSSLNTSELLARVQDSEGNPVKGIRVNFSAVSDPSNGSITPPFAVTDSSGIATSSFTAGPNSSGQNLVQISSDIPSAPSLSAGATLTVAAQAISVRMHTGNTVETPDSTTYLLPYAAVVSDAAGNPVAGAQVTVSYTPVEFYKGTYKSNGLVWSPTQVATCASEDRNGNGVLDVSPLEDVNSNGMLDPGNVAVAFVSSEGGITDASGFVLLGIKYPKGFANWVSLKLQVTITAPSGTETVSSRPIELPALSSDLSDLSVLPPGGTVSVFGALADCRQTG